MFQASFKPASWCWSIMKKLGKVYREFEEWPLANADMIWSYKLTVSGTFSRSGDWTLQFQQNSRVKNPSLLFTSHLSCCLWLSSAFHLIIVSIPPVSSHRTCSISAPLIPSLEFSSPLPRRDFPPPLSMPLPGVLCWEHDSRICFAASHQISVDFSATTLQFSRVDELLQLFIRHMFALQCTVGLWFVACHLPRYKHRWTLKLNFTACYRSHWCVSWLTGHGMSVSLFKSRAEP